MSDPVNSNDEDDARCESELVLEAGMYTACDCKARQAHAHHEALSPLAPDCSYGGEASPSRQPSDHDRTVADGHTLTNTLRYACWLRSHDAEVAAAVRAEAVADERRRIRRQVADEIADRLEESSKAGVVGARHRDALLVAARIARAAGSVPVATPPAEPATTVHDANCEQQLGACCCHCQKRADVAFSHAAPSRPVTCEHGKTGWHLYVDRRSPISGTRQCPGPVSVPKESSE